MGFKTICAVLCCGRNKAEDDHVILHRFPREASRCAIWLTAVGNAELMKKSLATLQGYNICSMHFSDDQYQTYLRQRLNRNAMPNLNLSHSKEQIESSDKVVREYEIVPEEPNDFIFHSDSNNQTSEQRLEQNTELANESCKYLFIL